MSWTIAGVTSGNATADTSLGTFTIPSQSYTAGTVYFVGFLWANLVNAQAGALVSITGSGLTPTLVSAGNYGASTGRRRLEVWTFTPAANTTTTLIVTFAVGENSTAHCWSVVSANAKTTGTLPQAAVMNRSTSASTIIATLSTFADAGNAALGFFGAVGSNGAMTVGSGFTQLHSEVVASGTTICLLSEYVASQDTTVDATAGGVNDIIGIGFELAASSLIVTAPPASATAASSAPALTASVTGVAGSATAAVSAPMLSAAVTAPVAQSTASVAASGLSVAPVSPPATSNAQSPAPTPYLAVQAQPGAADATLTPPALSASPETAAAGAIASAEPPTLAVTLEAAPGSATTATVLHVLTVTVTGSAANATATFPAPSLPIAPGSLTTSLEASRAALSVSAAGASTSTASAGAAV